MKKLIICFSILLVLAASTKVHAQCAMCTKAAAEATKNGKKIGLGLNSGILMLLAMPYSAIMVIGGVWYYNNKNKKTKYVKFYN
jgi:hypothetical protein